MMRIKTRVGESKDATDDFDTEIVMGEKYRDTVSGYEGVATSVHFYLHGCERVTLEQWNADKGELHELTFDSPRLEHIASKTQITSTKTGGDKFDAPRRGSVTDAPPRSREF